jgi:hypothetical protein
MNDISAIFKSPDYYPMSMDFRREVLRFVRMSPDAYRDSVFLDTRTKFLGGIAYEIRLDDVLFAERNQRIFPRPIHYILHTTFCCSTLLARYFEALESCFVLKEPLLLTQLAVTPPRSVEPWDEVFDVGMKLLSRGYEPSQITIIKPHEPCNVLAGRLLERDVRSTVTFLIIPLKQFLLAILKSKERRAWIRTRIRSLYPDALPQFAPIAPEQLTDAESAAYLWLVNRFLCEQLRSGEYGSRVLVIDGNMVADAPEAVLSRVSQLCGLNLDDGQLELLQRNVKGRYSKDVFRPFDAIARKEELTQLEDRFGSEVEAGLRLAEPYRIVPEVPVDLKFART